MISRITLCVLDSIYLCGCAALVAPSPEELKHADFGAPPKDSKGIVMAYIKSTFKDPYTIQDLTVQTPVKSWETAPPLLGGKTVYGYKIFFSVNSKNSFGAYTGIQQYVLFTPRREDHSGSGGPHPGQVNTLVGM